MVKGPNQTGQPRSQLARLRRDKVAAVQAGVETGPGRRISRNTPFAASQGVEGGSVCVCGGRL